MWRLWTLMRKCDCAQESEVCVTVTVFCVAAACGELAVLLLCKLWGWCLNTHMQRRVLQVCVQQPGC